MKWLLGGKKCWDRVDGWMDGWMNVLFVRMGFFFFYALGSFVRMDESCSDWSNSTKDTTDRNTKGRTRRWELIQYIRASP